MHVHMATRLLSVISADHAVSDAEHISYQIRHHVIGSYEDDSASWQLTMPTGPQLAVRSASGMSTKPGLPAAAGVIARLPSICSLTVL